MENGTEAKEPVASTPQPWADAVVPEDPEAKLTAEQRTKLMLSIGQECIMESELYQLMKIAVEGKKVPVAYDGFEPSGRMHIAQALLKAINVNKMLRAGCCVKIWVADWFAYMNGKLGGKLENIRTCGQYFVEIWRALGMDVGNVKFIWASEKISKHPKEYMERFLAVARENTVVRLRRCSQIMGREEKDDQPSAQLMYPCMQCADIFFLKADICQLGYDQRKVNMLAREFCSSPSAKQLGLRHKPIVLSHKMLPGLKEGQEKMSKSDPNSAIFCDDEAEDVTRKIVEAYCPTDKTKCNPVLKYAKALVLPRLGKLVVERQGGDGEAAVYVDKATLTEDFWSGKIQPEELKVAVAKALNEILEPVRTHFKTDEEAGKLAEAVKMFRVTK